MERKSLRQLLPLMGFMAVCIILLSFNRPSFVEKEKPFNRAIYRHEKLEYEVIILKTKDLKDLMDKGDTVIVFQQVNRKDDAIGAFHKRHRYGLIAYVYNKDDTVKENQTIFYAYKDPSVKINRHFKEIVDKDGEGIDANFGNIKMNLNDTCLKLRQINPETDENYKFIVLHPRAGGKKGNRDYTDYVVYDVYYASGKKDIDPNDSPEGKIDYQALLTLNPSPPA